MHHNLPGGRLGSTFVALLLILLWGGVQPSYANLNLLFTTDHNLPNTLLNEIREDADEMIWIATEDGLCRYDGSRFVTYRNEPGNPNSLQSNFVRTLCTDERGYVLVGTLAGVQMYRPLSDDFTPVICDTTAGILPGNVIDISPLANGDFLAAGNIPFTIRIDHNGQPQAVPNPFTHEITLTYRCCEDPEGNLWMIRFNDGIYRVGTDGRFAQIPLGDGLTGFTSLGVGPDGKIYAGGPKRGLYKYVAKTGDFVEVSAPDDNGQVCEILPVPGTQQMYICTDGMGVRIYDCITGSQTPYLFDDALIDSEIQKVHSLAVSCRGDVWMALYQKGVFVVSHNPVDFHYYGPKSLRYNCVGDRCITSLLRGHDGLLWVGTDNGGLYGIGEGGHTAAHFPCTPHPHSVPSAIINLFEDSRQRLWIGSYRQGGGIMDLKSGSCRYIPIEGQQDATSNIYAFAEDKNNQIWVGSMGSGLLRFDEERQIFVREDAGPAADWTGCLYYDSHSDLLFLGTYNGLVIYRIGYTPSPGDPPYSNVEHCLGDVVIYSITRCSATQISLCTNSGLIMFDTQTRQWQTYTTQDGLPSNNVFASQTDGEGNLWISSGSCLSKFNMRQQTFNNFTLLDGLQSSEFYKNASFRDGDGTLWFGGTMGITWFNPHRIAHQQQEYAARIVRLSADRTVILPTPEGRRKRSVYRISNQDHSFTIELATRPILQTHSVIYRYSMDGAPWETLPPMMNRVSFSQIESGDHEFRFQILHDGVESEVESVLITIARPWYRSWWASLLWLLVLSIIGWLLWQFLQRKRVERHLRRRQERETAINEAKLQFFMNIAHEFRTPMTLVVSPLQKLINSDSNPSRQHSYQLIHRNASRVLALINQMMDLRKIDKSQMHLLCRRLSPINLVQELCDSVEDLAENRGITLNLLDRISTPAPNGSGTPSAADTSAHSAALQMWIDEDCFSKILLNLLSNAIKFTPKGGSIAVEISSHDNNSATFPDGYFRLSVTDTGIGISPADRLHVFDRFYQVRQSGKASMGTGIGLNLVHALVRLHHGTIRVEDNPDGQGSRFIVCLPLGERAFRPTELLSTAVEAPAEPSSPTAVAPSTALLDSLRQDEPQEPQALLAHAPRILIVEDDDEVRSYLTTEIGHHYRITDCANGREALDQLQTNPDRYSLVLSDVMMPEMDGIELCLHIRSNVHINHLPIVLLTARSGDEDRLRALEIGANAFISKPFNLEILLNTIHNLIETQRRLRSSFSGTQLPTDRISTPELLSPDERLLQRVVRIIDERISDPELTGERLADEVGISRVHLYRKLKELTNQSARGYIRNIRLTKAAELLSTRKMSISEVAYQVGFPNPTSFTTLFRKMYGLSPREYNERHCGQAENPD